MAVGMDLTNNVFVLHGVDETCKVVLRRPHVKRDQLLEHEDKLVDPRRLDLRLVHRCLPLVAIGALVKQIPCWHEYIRSHFRCRIYNCRRLPNSQHINQPLGACGGVYIRRAKLHLAAYFQL